MCDSVAIKDEKVKTAIDSVKNTGDTENHEEQGHGDRFAPIYFLLFFIIKIHCFNLTFEFISEP